MITFIKYLRTKNSKIDDKKNFITMNGEKI